MVGIVSYNAYVPRYRLSRKTILKSMGWFNPVMLPGERSVANYDQDAITLAVEAAMGCLNGVDRATIDGVYLASTSAPYLERQNAGIMAGALDVPEDCRTADFAGSTKSGTSALLAAFEAVKAGTLSKVITAAADVRLGKMGSMYEALFGDAGVAFLLGSENVIATIDGSYTLSRDFVDVKRATGQKFVSNWEDRWIRDEGYLKMIPMAIQGYLKKNKVSIQDFAKVVYACPYGREHGAIGKMFGVAPEKIQNNLIDFIGDAGSAHAPLMLAAALDEAQPGDKILVVSYGYGAEAIGLTVTDAIKNARNERGVQWYVENKKELDNYQKYAVFRGLLPLEIGLRGEDVPVTPFSALYREREMVTSFCGSKCTECGTPQYPPQLICVNAECGAVKKMEKYRFSDKIGHLFSYTGDALAVSLNPPSSYGFVDFEGGGRYKVDLTDCEPEMVKTGMAVKMSFRRKYLDESRGVHAYHWKAVPV